MAGLAEILAQHEIIGIDTPLFIYAVEDHPQYASLAQTIIDHVDGGGSRGVSSAVSLMEIAVKPLREQQLEIALKYLLVIESIENFVLFPILLADAWRAGVLRASNTLRPADALQLATCIGAGATLFVTNDRRLRQINEIDVLVLDDYV